jgi:hypothetical protein
MGLTNKQKANLICGVVKPQPVGFREHYRNGTGAWWLVKAAPARWVLIDRKEEEDS